MFRRKTEGPLRVMSRHRVPSRPRHGRYSPQTGHSSARFTHPLSANSVREARLSRLALIREGGLRDRQSERR